MSYTYNEDGSVTKKTHAHPATTPVGCNNNAECQTIKRLKNQINNLAFRYSVLENEHDKLIKQIKNYKYCIGMMLVLPLIIIVAYILYLNITYDTYYIISSQVNIRNQKNYGRLYVVDHKKYGEKFKGKIDTEDGWCRIITYNPLKSYYVTSKLVVSSDDFKMLEDVINISRNCRTELRDRPFYSRAIIDYFTNHETPLNWRVYRLNYKDINSSTSKKEFAFYIKHNVTGESKLIKYKIDSDNPLYISEKPLAFDALPK